MENQNYKGKKLKRVVFRNANTRSNVMRKMFSPTEVIQLETELLEIPE